MNARAQQKRAKRSRRNKPHRPKHVHIPITGLRDDFGLVLHTALRAATLGYFSKEQYDRIGQALNTLWGALELRPPKDPSVKTGLEGAMRAMNDAGRRGDASDIWDLRELERDAILAGIKKAEAYLPYMDVLTLHKSMQLFKTAPQIPAPDAQPIFVGIAPGSIDRCVVAEVTDGKVGRVIHIERTAA